MPILLPKADEINMHLLLFSPVSVSHNSEKTRRKLKIISHLKHFVGLQGKDVRVRRAALRCLHN